jgi:hypothetical protein
LQHCGVFSIGQPVHLASGEAAVPWLGLSTYPASKIVPAAKATTTATATTGFLESIDFIRILLKSSKG